MCIPFVCPADCVVCATQLFVCEENSELPARRSDNCVGIVAAPRGIKCPGAMCKCCEYILKSALASMGERVSAKV